MVRLLRPRATDTQLENRAGPCLVTWVLLMAIRGPSPAFIPLLDRIEVSTYISTNRRKYTYLSVYHVSTEFYLGIIIGGTPLAVLELDLSPSISQSSCPLLV